MTKKRLQVFDLPTIAALPAHEAAGAMLQAPLPEEMTASNGVGEHFQGYLEGSLEGTHGTMRDPADQRLERIENYGNADIDQDLDGLMTALSKVSQQQALSYQEKNALALAGNTLSGLQQNLRTHIREEQKDNRPLTLLSEEGLRALRGYNSDAAKIVARLQRPRDEEHMVASSARQIAYGHEIDMLEDVKKICSQLCRQLGIQERGQGPKPPAGGGS